jgi:putative membrane protein
MQMKSFYRVAALLAIVSVAACAQTDDADQEAGSDTAAAAPGATPAQTTGAVSDPQILHIAKTANDADIEGGNLAQSKSQNADVKAFANLMISDHTAANQAGMQAATAAGVTPQDNPTSQQLMADHQAATQRLQSLSGAEFDKAYIGHEVDVHQKVLNALDQTLIPNAQNPELKNVLTQVRATVEAHLTRARDIQGNLR